MCRLYTCTVSCYTFVKSLLHARTECCCTLIARLVTRLWHVLWHTRNTSCSTLVVSIRRTLVGRACTRNNVFPVILRDPLGRILSDLASLLLHIRWCIYEVRFVAHTLHLCLTLDTFLFGGFAPFWAAQPCATFARCILVLSRCVFVLLWMWLLYLSRHMFILCVVTHCDLVVTILALLLCRVSLQATVTYPSSTVRELQ
jgi:hypothetical protein